MVSGEGQDALKVGATHNYASGVSGQQSVFPFSLDLDFCLRANLDGYFFKFEVGSFYSV